MGQTRPIKTCLNCREEKPIVAHGLCDNCRQKENRSTPKTPDQRRTPTQLRKKRQKLQKAFTGLMNAAENLDFTDEEMKDLRDTAKPHMFSILDTSAGIEDEEMEAKAQQDDEESIIPDLPADAFVPHYDDTDDSKN